MNSINVKARAKLNLTLHVTGRQGAYHTLDSIITPIDIYDVIKIKKRADGLASVTMHGMGSESISPEKNNALIAAESFIKAFGCAGADITIYKNIPMGAGLGGSSADAAGVLSGLARLYGIGSEEEISLLADGIGSDVRAMLKKGYTHMTGRGTQTEPINSALKLNFVIIIPKGEVSSAQCYKKYDEMHIPYTESSGKDIEALKKGDLAEFAKYVCNDLTRPAQGILKDIESELFTLASFSPVAYSMTGSGSAVFAVSENKEFCDYIKSRYRGSGRIYCAKNYPF